MSTPAIVLFAAVAAGLVSGTGLAGARWLAAVGAARRRGEELRVALEASGSEPDVRRRLLTHLSRLLPEAGLALLAADDAGECLEPTFGDRISGTPVSRLPLGPVPRERCQALVRGEPQQRESEDDRSDCPICGGLAGATRCTPLTVGEERLGALLVTGEAPLAANERRALAAALTTAAPLIALRRAQAGAERRAGVDALTGLPNPHVAEAELVRLSARAGRTISPLTAIAVDLDHLAALNARHGRDAGDRVLAAVARLLAARVRASDFVARDAGPGFLVLAPDTDRRGGAELAEKLRAAVALALVPGLGAVTASFGVAALPEDAAEPVALVRRAGDALRTAKAAGRNRVAAAV